MQILKEIRVHLANFDTEAREEIHRFIDWLHTKYAEPSAAVVAPPETSYVEPVPSFIAPVVDVSIVTPAAPGVDGASAADVDNADDAVGVKAAVTKAPRKTAAKKTAVKG